MPTFHCEYIWLDFQIRKGYSIQTNEKGIITDIFPTPENVPFLPGLTIPGLVNTHCHLELSHLRGKIPRASGMVSFLEAIVKLRKETSYFAEAQQNAMQSMQQKGIVAVADIANEKDNFELKKDYPGLYVHTFIELLGMNPYDVGQIVQRGIRLLRYAQVDYALSASLTVHAFYSVSIPLLRAINEISGFMSIHLLESFAELEFFSEQKGDLIFFFSKLGLLKYLQDYRWGLVEQIIPQVFNSDKRILWVHNTVLSAHQFQILAETFPQSYFCLCPLSNLYINQILPAVEVFDWDRVTLGTDSLASNDELNIISEIQCLQTYYPFLTLEKLLKAATYNGAKFLGLTEKIGEISVGKAPGLVNIFPFDFSRGKIPPQAKIRVLALPCFD